MHTETQPMPTLQDETQDLGVMLKAIAEDDPSARPSEAAAAAFLAWITEVGPGSLHPDYFEDVRENYDVSGNSNADLFDLFAFLQSHIPLSDIDEAWEDEPPKTFIDLPLMAS
jgi:hypothetical protein